MAPVGPQLPISSSEKRKRTDTEHENDSDDDKPSSDSDVGPAPPSLTTSEGIALKRARVIGPSLPPPKTQVQRPEQTSASLSDRSESSDEDDFGPSLPPTNLAAASDHVSSAATALQAPAPSESAATVKRDDWMMVPPTGGDWTGRIDPTKLKNRKFNTGKGVKGPSTTGGSATDTWHETPQEKQARLQREMMGIKDSQAKSNVSQQVGESQADKETEKRLREYNKSRGPTLYDSHQKGQKVEQDDDPSARAFDREKDIGGGLQINATQRRDMLKKASDFGSRFSGAKYL